MRGFVVWLGVLGMACGEAQEGGCLSETEQDLGEALLWQLTDYDSEGRIVRDEGEYTVDGRPVESYLEEFRYIDGRLVHEIRSTDSQVIQSTEWFYRYDGDRLVETIRVVPSGARLERAYAYDGQGELAETWFAGPPEQVLTYAYDEGGRLVEVVNTGEEGGVMFRQTFGYLEDAPSLDADITTMSGSVTSERRDLYDGDLLVRRTGFDTLLDVDVDERWAYRSDGQVTQYWSLVGESAWTAEYEYDDDDHLIAVRGGSDENGDDVMDQVDSEQTWTWTCW